MKVAHLMAALSSGAPGVLAATSGSFDVLAMNVAGLPPIFNDNEVPGDKATNARMIGSYFAEYGYDIINLQEVRWLPLGALFARQNCGGVDHDYSGLQLPRLHLRNG